ncbi:MAG: hypothetical protein LDL27_08300 [Desulfovibrio sp.]|nr:hypothetical protein [Desulfovibrio sp.]
MNTDPSLPRQQTSPSRTTARSSGHAAPGGNAPTDIVPPRFRLDPSHTAPTTGDRKKLGEMLVEDGLLSADDLHKALAAHKSYGMKLGQYLIQRNLVDERNIVRLLAKQLRVEMFDPDKYPPTSPCPTWCPRPSPTSTCWCPSNAPGTC